MLHRFTRLALIGILFSACCLPAQAQEVSARALEHVIAAYRSKGADSTLAEFERLATDFSRQGEEILSLRARRYIGECQWRLGRFDESRITLTRAIEQAEAIDAQWVLGDLFNVLGLVEWDSGNYQSALHAFERSKEIALALDDRKLQAMAINNSSMVLDELGDYEGALKRYQHALDIYQAIDFERGAGDTLGNLGGTHLLLGHYTVALEYYQQALAISAKLQSSVSLSQDHGNIALCLLGMGRMGRALAHFDQAIDHAARAGLKLDVAYWTASKGSALVQSGRYDLGLPIFREAIEQYEQIGARSELIETRQEMGNLLATLGDEEAAERQFQQSLEASQTLQHARGTTMNLMSLGALNARRESWSDAAEFYTSALRRSEVSGQQTFQAQSLLQLARIEQHNRQFDHAQKRIQHALQLAQKNAARSLVAEAHYLAAENYRQTENHEQAQTIYNLALTEAVESSSTELLWKIYRGQARSFEASGQLVLAVGALQFAVSVIEDVRNRLLESRYRSGYVQDKFEVYVDLVRLQLELGNREQAFEMAERLRSRTFYRVSQPPQYNTISSPDEVVRHELRERIRHLQKLLEEEQLRESRVRRQAAIDTFSRELMQAENDYLAFLDDRGLLNPEVAESDAISGSNALRKQLQSGEALVEYVLAEQQVLIFLIRPDGFHTTTTNVSRQNIESQIGLLRDLVLQPEHNRWRDPADALAESLIEPMQEKGWLDEVQHLYIVPHATLNYLPFSLLPLGPQSDVLVQTLDLTYLPAAQLLLEPGKPKLRNTRLLSMAPGNTGLLHADEEARSIGAMFEPHVRLLLGSEATESRFKSLAGDYRFLHLATHGYFDHVNPLFSWLELESDEWDDGRLEVHEILGLRLNAQLVTLSACQTALASGLIADLPAGDEFVGLTRAFLASGGESVLATLWEVDDQSSVRLMQHFYHALADRSADISMAVFLSRAQRQLQAVAETRHPYHWAPYVLVGAQRPADAPEIPSSEV